MPEFYVPCRLYSSLLMSIVCSPLTAQYSFIQHNAGLFTVLWPLFQYKLFQTLIQDVPKCSSRPSAIVKKLTTLVCLTASQPALPQPTSQQTASPSSVTVSLQPVDQFVPFSAFPASIHPTREIDGLYILSAFYCFIHFVPLSIRPSITSRLYCWRTCVR